MKVVRGSRKHFLWLGVGLGVLLVFLDLLLPLPSLSPIASHTVTHPGMLHVVWPESGQASVEEVHAGFIGSNGVQAQVPIASVAKTLTALAVLQKHPLSLGEQGPLITMNNTDVDLYAKYLGENGSNMPVTEGEQLTEYQALQAMMLPSANNIADSLANWAFGSFTAYKLYAQDMIKHAGMRHTTIGDDASGFLPTTTSTSNDLLLLAHMVAQNPVLMQIVGQRSATLPEVGQVLNVNTLLGRDGFIGIKTGNTDQAGGCFVFADSFLAGTTQFTFVGSVAAQVDLPSALRAADVLVISLQKDVSTLTPIKAGTVVASYRLPWGGLVPVTVQQSPQINHLAGTSLETDLSLRAVSMKARKGDSVGSVTLKADGQTVSVKAILARAIPSPPLWWRLIGRWKP